MQRPCDEAVLVTGGAGYIGSHAAKLLARAGLLPVVIDNLSTGHRWAARFGPFVHADIGNRDAIAETVARYRISSAIHFAGKAYVGESVVDPRKYFRENVSKTVQMLDSLIEGGVRRVIFSSTCATYGIPERIPIKENELQRPLSPYGESKLFVERMLDWYGKAYGLEWVALRYFNAAGADPEGEVGEAHTPETHLIPSVIEAALGVRSRVEVFGRDYPTPDGTAVRDYTHVWDIARAHLLALQYLASGQPSRPFNLGTGRGYSVLDVIRGVERASGRRIVTATLPRRSGDAPELVADASEARRKLGWGPEFKRLDEVIQTAWAWHSQGVRRRAASA